MGTLQQELIKVQTLDNLSFDDDPGAPSPPSPVQLAQPLHRGVSSAVARGDAKSKRQIYWEWLRDHPSSTAREIAEGVGESPTTIANILSTFLERNIASRVIYNDAYTYCTTVDAYPSTTLQERITKMIAGRTANRHMKQEPAAVKLKAPKHKAKAKAVPPEQVAQPTQGQVPVPSYNPLMISTWPIAMAREVYDELKKYFGDAA